MEMCKSKQINGVEEKTLAFSSKDREDENDKVNEAKR